MSLDILIAGVGGQGTILASKLFAKAAGKTGSFVRTAETIGMAQRGGSVVSHIRIDSQDKSPAVPTGMADVLIGFEPAEAARNLYRLKKDGVCIVNLNAVVPVTASLSGNGYPYDEIICYLQKHRRTILVDGEKLAFESGSVKAVNVVLMGAAVGCGAIDIDKALMLQTILETVPEKWKKANKTAFEKGLIEGIR